MQIVLNEQNRRDMLDKFKSIPSADVRENIHGEWKKISPAGIYECSNCGREVMTSDIDVYNFCHRCGADMRKGEQ